jgi:hypothetical protein
MSSISIYFDEDKVMHVCPKDTIGVMALEQFEAYLQAHGLKMIKFHTEIPLHDPFKGIVKPE